MAMASISFAPLKQTLAPGSYADIPFQSAEPAIGAVLTSDAPRSLCGPAEDLSTRRVAVKKTRTSANPVQNQTLLSVDIIGCGGAPTILGANHLTWA